MKVFAIVVTYNGIKWYDRCMESLCNSEIPLDIIVVDNASSDGTVEYIQNKYPEIILVKSDKNLGFGQANNKGIRYALDHDADYVFLLNQDAWIKPDTLSTLVAVAEKHTEYGIISPIHLCVDDKIVNDSVLFYLLRKQSNARDLLNDFLCKNLKDVYTVDGINAAAWLIPRKTIEVVGGFDPLFFHYGEDDNYMQRVNYHEFLIGLCPLCTIIHDHDVSFSRQMFQKNFDERCLLIDVANINRSYKIRNIIAHNMKNVIKQLLKLNMTAVRFLLKENSYLIKNDDKIKKSRNTNVITGRSWL